MNRPEEKDKVNITEERARSGSMLTLDEQIDYLKFQGVTFNLASEKEARLFLRNNIYYFKLASYKKNYDKHRGGKEKGKYIKLDFAYLQDLSAIDMRLRAVLVQLALDIEHHTKLELIRMIEDRKEDGYSIYKEFMRSLDDENRRKFENEIQRNKASLYTGEKVLLYEEEYPIWVFLELIQFGRLTYFYKFCAQRYQDKAMENRYHMLQMCRDIRNAAAHNNCIINNLRPGSTPYSTTYPVLHELAKIKGLSKLVYTKKMSGPSMQHIVTVLYMHKIMVRDRSMRYKAIQDLWHFKDYMLYNLDYYRDNDLVRSNFLFLERVIDSWFKKI